MDNKRAFQGAGLGLSITKAYVEMLGGSIWLESIPEKGSQFYFTIPYKNLDSNHLHLLEAPSQIGKKYQSFKQPYFFDCGR